MCTELVLHVGTCSRDAEIGSRSGGLEDEGGVAGLVCDIRVVYDLQGDLVGS